MQRNINTWAIVKKYYRNYDGLSIIEFLVSIGIMVLFGLVIVLGRGDVYKNKILTLSLDTIVATLRATQAQSKSQENNNVWGVRFMSAVATSSYDVFQGATWTQNGVARRVALPPTLLFSEPQLGKNYEVSFGGQTGLPLSSKILTLIQKSKKNNIVGDVILTNLGKISTRLERGVLGYWHIDNWNVDDIGGSSVPDASETESRAVIVGTPTWQTGTNCISGNCLSFNDGGGTEDFLFVTDSTRINPTNAVTVEGWFYARSFTNITGSYVSKRNSFILHPESNGDVGFYVYINGSYVGLYVTQPSIVLNTWQHWVGTYDGSYMKIYLNGSLKAYREQTGVLGTTGDIFIGSDAGCSCGTRFLDGKIDEVRIYDRALSEQEILDHYHDFRA